MASLEALTQKWRQVFFVQSQYSTGEATIMQLAAKISTRVLIDASQSKVWHLLSFGYEGMEAQSCMRRILLEIRQEIERMPGRKLSSFSQVTSSPSPIVGRLVDRVSLPLFLVSPLASPPVEDELEYPQANSNRCLQLERLPSQASRPWGHIGKVQQKHCQPTTLYRNSGCF